MTNHTPGPWHITRRDDLTPEQPNIIFGPEGTRRDGSSLAPIATVNGDTEEDRANAELIVRAVNHHEELVELLKRITGSCGEFVEDENCDCDPYDLAEAILNDARALLAKLEGGAK